MKNKRNRATRSISLNRIYLPMAVQRDIILEGSDYYRANVHSLASNTALTSEEAGRILPSIRMAALRLAGVSLRQSEAMLKA